MILEHIDSPADLRTLTPDVSLDVLGTGDPGVHRRSRHGHRRSPRFDTVHGNVESSGKLYVKKGAHILGDVIAKEIFLHEDAKIDGTIEAPHGMLSDGGSELKLSILEVDEVTFIEPSFAALTDPLYTDMLARDNADQGRMLVDENATRRGRLHESRRMVGRPFFCRHPNVALIDAFEQVNGEIYQEDRAGCGGSSPGTFPPP